MKLYYLLFSLFLLTSTVVQAQCLTPELALINACVEHPNPNGSGTTVEAELIVLRNGLGPIAVNELGFDVPNNNFGADNNDVGVDVSGNAFTCGFRAPAIAALPGCANVIPLGPGDTIPASAVVVFFTTGTTTTADLSAEDFANICQGTDPVYVLQNACERTSGAFANGPGTGNPLRTISVISPCGSLDFSYDTQLLDPDPGTYFLIGSSTYGNDNCDLPSLPVSCRAVDTTYFLCDAGGSLDPVPVTDFADFYPPSISSVSFHGSAVEAANATNAISSYQPVGTQLDTLYARQTNASDFCVNVGLFIVQYQPFAGTVGLDCQLAQETSGPGLSDGAISLSFASGVPPYTVQYSGAAASAVEVSGAMGQLTGLPAGQYSITARDATGCNEGSCTVEVTDGAPLALACAVRNDANAMVAGSIIATVSGGAAPYEVQISGGPGATTLTNQAAGDIVLANLGVATYTITVTDAAGQQAMCMQEVMQENCPLVITDIQLLVSDCSGADNSIIRLSLAGNDGFINTVWSGGNNIDIFNGLQEAGPLPPGDYFVSVSDQSGCPPIMAGPISVIDPGRVMATLTSTVASSSCIANGNATISVNSGGIPPYTVVLTDNAGNDLTQLPLSNLGDVTFSGLAGVPGTITQNYGFYVEDSFGCPSDTSFFNVSSIPQSTISLDPAGEVLIPPTCFGGADGSLTITATGGSGPYTYNWLVYPGQSQGIVLPPGAQQTNLLAGTYEVEVTEAGGCRDTFALVLADGQRPGLVCGMTTPGIGNVPGRVMLNLSGLNPPFIISFDNGAGQQGVVTNVSAGDTTLSFTSEGLYQIYLTDQSGCTSDTCTVPITITPCDITVQADITPVDCTGEGQLAIVPVGGQAPFTFSWDEPSFPARDTVVPLDSGRYRLVLEDASGCTVDTTFAVGLLDNAPDFALMTFSVLPDCYGDSLQLPVAFSGVGPFALTFSLSNGGQPVIIDTTVVLMATDTMQLAADLFRNGGTVQTSRLADQQCTASLSLTADYTLVRPDTIQRFEEICDPAGITIGGQLFTPMMPSDTFIVDDGSACGIRYEVDLDFLGDDARDTIRRFEDVCNPAGIMIGGQLFTEAMPSDTFLFDDGSVCGIRYEVDLNFTVPTATDTLDVFICPGTSYEVPQTGDIFNAARPEGEVAFPRPGQCDSLVYIRLDIPQVLLGSFSTAACAGDTIFYGDRFFTVDDPGGVANLVGQAANGCDSLVAVNVNFRRVGELRLLGDHVICRGDSIELRFAYDGTGGVNALLEDLQGNTLPLSGVQDGSRVLLTPEESTTWSIVAVGAGGCPGTFSGRSVIMVNDLNISTEVLTNPVDFCNDTLGLAIVMPERGVPPYSIMWSNGPIDEVNRNLLPGTYFVDVLDGQGCLVRDSVVIDPRRGLTASLTALPPLCLGGFGRLQLDSISGGAGGYAMSLDDDLFLPVERVGDFRPPVGLGTATFIDADDCRVQVDYIVPNALRPVFNPLQDTTIFVGDSVLLDPQVVFPFTSVMWTPPATLRSPNSLVTIAVPRETTEYTLDMVSEDGCAFTYRIRVRVDERTQVYAPSAFSPNGDDLNDVYRLEYGDRVTAILTFQIFNRWGTLMYEGVDGWDGTINGRPAQQAVYIYQATVQLVDGTERYIKGEFVLRR